MRIPVLRALVLIMASLSDPAADLSNGAKAGGWLKHSQLALQCCRCLEIVEL